MIKTWYSFQGGKPENDDASFYEKENFSWTYDLLRQSNLIREEIRNLVNEERAKMPVYFNTSLVEKGTKWKTFSFMFWGIPFRKNMKRCPVTVAAIKGIPGLVSFSISMLEAGSRIKPHRGDTNAIVRCHIPITIPGKLPENGFRVGTESREWKDDDILLFNDAQEHEAWNLSDRERIILILDVMRPEFMHEKKQVSR